MICFFFLLMNISSSQIPMPGRLPNDWNSIGVASVEIRLYCNEFVWRLKAPISKKTTKKNNGESALYDILYSNVLVVIKERL